MTMSTDLALFSSLMSLRLRPICYMFKLWMLQADITVYVYIIGIFDHPITRGHRWQVWGVYDEGDWPDSGPLYAAGSYTLKTWNKSAESRIVRVITKKFDYTGSGIFSKAIFLSRFAWRTVSKALLKSSAMTTAYGFMASMSLMVCSKVMLPSQSADFDRSSVSA